jgi:hypothetical protein
LHRKLISEAVESRWCGPVPESVELHTISRPGQPFSSGRTGRGNDRNAIAAAGRRLRGLPADAETGQRS